MTFDSYLGIFDEILNSSEPIPPYNDEHYFNYLELNHKRQERWNKKGVLKPETLTALSKINQELNWVLITEPWCGDAAHSNPFIAMMANQNDKIKLEVQLRDSGSEIDKYLTNGGKSIPILVVRNAKGDDVFVWGPRPAEAQEIHLKNRDSNKGLEEQKVDLQKWYNSDKGETIQDEIYTLLNSNNLID